MQALKFHHEDIRTLASRELFKFGIKIKLKKLPSKKGSPKKRCFGVPLKNMETVEITFGKDEGIPVPKLFIDLCNFIRANDMKEEGIFRIEGSKVKEKHIVKVLNEGYTIPQDTSNIEACSALKIFLRNIPGHVIPMEHMEPFVRATQLENNSDIAIHLAVLLLPLENIFLLAYLMQFFNEVTLNSAKNKMDSYNMAVVLAPNLFPVNPKAGLQQQREISTTTLKVAKIMIEKNKLLGVVTDALIQKLEALHEEQDTSKKTCLFF